MPDYLLIWGIHPVEEAIKTRPEFVKQIEILPSFGRKKSQRGLLELLYNQGLQASRRADFHKYNLPKGAVHQGVCAKVKVFWETSLEEIIRRCLSLGQSIVACDQIEDPQNLGALIRAAVAFEVSGIVIPKRQNASINGTVVKASSGAVFHAQICTKGLAVAIKAIKQERIPIVGLDSRGAIPIYKLDIKGPVCLILGSESKGIRKNIRKMTDVLGVIPINPVLDSLNVSNAASVALYEFKRKKLCD